ncbi:MAG TPA: amidohydrolase family protein, partial [Ilumatobacteraceae bacterium]
MTAAGLSEDLMSPVATTYDDMPEHCYDPAARVRAMDADGVLIEACFPNLPRFCGQEFMEGPDKQLGLLCIKAYNDFVIDEWAATAPGRFLSAIVIPLWDPVLAAGEMERCGAKGAKIVMFSELPHELGLPTIHDPRRYWDPVLRTAEEIGMNIGIHVGSSSKMPQASPDAPPTVPIIMMGWRAASPLLD